jgi:hypothetical protein
VAHYIENSRDGDQVGLARAIFDLHEEAGAVRSPGFLARGKPRARVLESGGDGLCGALLAARREVVRGQIGSLLMRPRSLGGPRGLR